MSSQGENRSGRQSLVGSTDDVLSPSTLPPPLSWECKEVDGLELTKVVPIAYCSLYYLDEGFKLLCSFVGGGVHTLLVQNHAAVALDVSDVEHFSVFLGSFLLCRMFYGVRYALYYLSHDLLPFPES